MLVTRNLHHCNRKHSPTRSKNEIRTAASTSLGEQNVPQQIYTMNQMSLKMCPSPTRPRDALLFLFSQIPNIVFIQCPSTDTLHDSPLQTSSKPPYPSHPFIYYLHIWTKFPNVVSSFHATFESLPYMLYVLTLPQRMINMKV